MSQLISDTGIITQFKDIDFQDLRNEYCTLEPIGYEHLDDLIAAAADGELWNLKYATIPKSEAMKAEITRRLELLSAGTMIPFAVIHNDSKRAVGMTTYCDMKLANKKVDIGWSWYAKSHQRTALNSNAKFLLLKYAFDNLGVDGVYFKVHTKNERSQKAVLRLGAKYIGIVGNYCTMPGKEPTDYYHYCINCSDWPKVKSNLII